MIHATKRRTTPIRLALGFTTIAAIAAASSPIATLHAYVGDREVTVDPTSIEENRLISDLRFPALQISPPQLSESKLLDNKATLFIAESAALPYIVITLQFAHGENSEPIDQAGRLTALASILQLAGGGDRSGEELARELRRLGSNISISANYRHLTIELSTLKRNFDASFALLEDLMLRPHFGADELAIAQNGIQSSILQRNDDPAGVARRKIMELLYPGLARGYALTIEDVESITLDQIRSEYQTRFTPVDMIVGVAGDSSGLPLRERIETLLRQLPSSAAPAATEEVTDQLQRRVAERYRGQIVHVVMPAEQAAIVISGHLPAHNSSHFVPLQLGNYILGGGSFNSRLMREIRTRRGLAYTASSHNIFLQHEGRFQAFSGTRSDSAAETLRLMLIEIENMRREPLSTKELQLAGEALANSLIFEFETPERHLSGRIGYRRNGLPDDHLERLPERIEATTAAEVQQSYARYFGRDQLYIVIVGPESLTEALEKIAPTRRVDLEEALH